jgi:hypothetical protein
VLKPRGHLLVDGAGLGLDPQRNGGRLLIQGGITSLVTGRRYYRCRT